MGPRCAPCQPRRPTAGTRTAHGLARDACLAFPFFLTQIPDRVSDVQHPKGESATNISAFLRASGTRKRRGTMQLQHRNGDSAALDEGPISQLASGPAALGLRIHRDWSIPGDGLPTVTSSPRSKRTSERLPVRLRIRASPPGHTSPQSTVLLTTGVSPAVDWSLWRRCLRRDG